MHHLHTLIQQYKADPESVFNTWFVNNDERLKAFRSIRRGVLEVVSDIREGRFPNDFKGSSLEFVLTCITEQKQVFEGASHPFYWKPKLRIPDIYENTENKRAFGQFLGNCLNAKSEKTLLDEVIRLDARRIKGLGPAVASILYFLHPTLMPPFNTAILNGFNTLFHEKRKLGSWSEYLKMREVVLEINRKHCADLSNDLGAVWPGCSLKSGHKKWRQERMSISMTTIGIKLKRQSKNAAEKYSATTKRKTCTRRCSTTSSKSERRSATTCSRPVTTVRALMPGIVFHFSAPNLFLN